MKYLMVVATAFLSTVKVTCQGSFAKKQTGAADHVFLNMLIFTVAGVLFLPFVFTAPPAVFGYAAVYAVCNTAFQLVYTRAIATGNLSVAVMFANFGMLVPIALSCAVYGDRPSALRVVGIVLTLCAFLVMARRGGTGQGKGNLKFAIAAMLANGAGLSVQKLFGASSVGQSNLAFVSVSYLQSALICAVLYIISTRRGSRRTVAVSGGGWLAAVGAGVSLALFLALNTYAAKVLDGSFQYPAHSGFAILFSTAAGILLFRDKFSKRQAVSCALGLAAIVLMNF